MSGPYDRMNCCQCGKEVIEGSSDARYFMHSVGDDGSKDEMGAIHFPICYEARFGKPLFTIDGESLSNRMARELK